MTAVISNLTVFNFKHLHMHFCTYFKKFRNTSVITLRYKTVNFFRGKEFITDISKLNSNGDQTREVILNLLCMVGYVVRWDENELMAQDF
jgi:hypothetical protein